MKKKYLKSVEDVIALKDTDTKIYAEDESGYYQFVSGILCAFDNEGLWAVGQMLYEEEKPYILEEEPMQEATEEDVGKLCEFWEGDTIKHIGVLEEILDSDTRPYAMLNDYVYQHCRRLSPAEVAEITGYGVTEDGSTFYGEPFKVVGKEK
jgi:hypothetical protein